MPTSKERPEKLDFSKARDVSGDPDASFLYGEGVRVAELPDGQLVPVPDNVPLGGKDPD